MRGRDSFSPLVSLLAHPTQIEYGGYTRTDRSTRKREVAVDVSTVESRFALTATSKKTCKGAKTRPLTRADKVLAILEPDAHHSVENLVVLEQVVMRVAVAINVENIRRRVVTYRRSTVSVETH